MPRPECDAIDPRLRAASRRRIRPSRRNRLGHIRAGLAGACLALAVVLAALTPAWAGGFIDDSGRLIEFGRPFTRIISLYGAHTENLFALGLDRQIIGVSRNESYPPQALSKPRFHYHDDPERFLAARPDLVLIRPMIFNGYRNLVANLERAGVTVVSLQPRTVGEMLAYWRKLGALTGRAAQAEALVARFGRRLAAVRAKTADLAPSARQRVYFESIHSKMKTFAPGAMAVFVLEAAGGINVAADARSVRGTNIAAYGKERILAKARTIDVYLAQRGPMNPVTRRTIFDEAGFQAIKAVKEGRVYIIDEHLVSRPTLRLIQGAQRIGRWLYPDRFGSGGESGRPTARNDHAQ